MKTKSILFCLFLSFNLSFKAQTYVTIPDANFVIELQSTYPNCMNGNQMNIECTEIINETILSMSNAFIADLTGIEYFINLQELYCASNYLTELTNLPNNLRLLNCSTNNLTEFPELTNSMLVLNIGNNQISNLPTLPNNLIEFACYDNNLTSLPVLPNSLSRLISHNNHISCFRNFHELVELSIYNNPFTCLPNYISAMDPSLILTYPLCEENNLTSNPFACFPSNGILGNTFIDINSDCILNSEFFLMNIPLKLFSSQDSLLRQTYSLTNGGYQFPQEIGVYTVSIDTLKMPYSFQCLNIDSTVILDDQNPFVDSVDFALTCKAGFDIGTQSVLTNGIVFPGQNHELKIITGDLSQWYNMNCASGIGGEVQISVSGSVAYQNPSEGVLTPTVSGNVFNYSIPDFGDIDIQNAFGLIFKTDTTAQAGDQICVSINVTPTNGDNNMSNNSFEYCYQVVNSYDPNMKEVYPIDVEPGFEDYFTYTIHFQNTGSAPAFNIRLLDTLDANLDLETFQVINYSHYNSTMLKNNILTFHFPNIMLADSTSDVEGSKGFVQYRIKPQANLALGTQIKNTAYIYFDFNAPIVTNTTINEYVQTVSISEKENSNIFVFPNPFSTSTTIAFKNSLTDADIKLYNVYGQEVRSITDFSGDKLKIERENLANGVYYLKVSNDNRASETVKLILKD